MVTYLGSFSFLLVCMTAAIFTAKYEKCSWWLYLEGALMQLVVLLGNAISASKKGVPINGTEWLIYFALLFLFWFAISTVIELLRRKNNNKQEDNMKQSKWVFRLICIIIFAIPFASLMLGLVFGFNSIYGKVLYKGFIGALSGGIVSIIGHLIRRINKSYMRKKESKDLANYTPAFKVSPVANKDNTETTQHLANPGDETTHDIQNEELANDEIGSKHASYKLILKDNNDETRKT